jgi:hypothetical protein
MDEKLKKQRDKIAAKKSEQDKEYVAPKDEKQYFAAKGSDGASSSAATALSAAENLKAKLKQQSQEYQATKRKRADINGADDYIVSNKAKKRKTE